MKEGASQGGLHGVAVPASNTIGAGMITILAEIALGGA